MILFKRLLATGITALLASPSPASAQAPAAAKAKGAISGTVTGNEQHVGFRAKIMKEAIPNDLAGSAQNKANDIVSFRLQGDAERLVHAVAAVREGTKKFSNILVTTIPATVDTSLDAFTIFAWTSTSRNIANPL
jgi:acylphosphatase